MKSNTKHMKLSKSEKQRLKEKTISFILLLIICIIYPQISIY